MQKPIVRTSLTLYSKVTGYTTKTKNTKVVGKQSVGLTTKPANARLWWGAMRGV